LSFNAASAAREGSRQRNGQFGAQLHAEPTVSLNARPAPDLGPDAYGSGSEWISQQHASDELAPYLNAYEADLQANGAPISYGDYESRLSPEQKGHLESDLLNIEADTTLTPADQLRFKDMAAQLDRFGAGYFEGPIRGSGRTAKFAKGSAYGGDVVPARFKNFRTGLEENARQAEAAQRERDRARDAEAKAPAARVPVAEPEKKKTGLGRFFGR
jgi:hypothetical protein